MIAYIWEEKVFYWCEGCGHAHHVPFPRWTFNGDVNKPTISPSVRHFYTNPDTKKETTVCHYFIKEGNIEYCGDCQHQLNGQTRPLIDIPEDYGLPGR